MTEELYSELSTHQSKFIAVVLDGCSRNDIPDVLMPIGRTFYYWPTDDEALYRRLTKQPRVVPAPLGDIILLDEVNR